jgi:hypothetical protein
MLLPLAGSEQLDTGKPHQLCSSSDTNHTRYCRRHTRCDTCIRELIVRPEHEHDHLVIQISKQPCSCIRYVRCTGTILRYKSLIILGSLSETNLANIFAHFQIKPDKFRLAHIK